MMASIQDNISVYDLHYCFPVPPPVLIKMFKKPTHSPNTYETRNYMILTEVSALDGAVVEGNTEVVTCLPQLRNGNAVRAADYPRLVVILPFSPARSRTHKRAERRMFMHAHKQGRENKAPLLMLLLKAEREGWEEGREGEG